MEKVITKDNVEELKKLDWNKLTWFEKCYYNHIKNDCITYVKFKDWELYLKDEYKKEVK